MNASKISILKTLITNLLLLLFIPSVFSQGKNINVDSLKTEVLNELNSKNFRFYFYDLEGKEQRLKLTDKIVIDSNSYIIFHTKTGIVIFNLLSMPSISYTLEPNQKTFTLYFYKTSLRNSRITPGTKAYPSTPVCEEKMNAFYGKFEVLRAKLSNIYNLNNCENMLSDFNVKYKNYQLQKEKSIFTEYQRRFVVQANAANEKRNYEEAILFYNKALEINPFSYPSAYYNIALISGQIKNYIYAILNMKKYLLLVPESEDARSCQDKIYEWEAQITK
jgi:tetratricopeptide (TPR) repeat protein